MSPALAVAQTCPVRGDVPANVDQHLRLAEAAAAGGAGLVLFPELSLTGYELDLASELAFTTDDPRLAPLAAGAAGLGVTLVVGAPVLLNATLHIGAFSLEPDGTMRLYTKQRLGAFSAGSSPDGFVPPPEASIFKPGKSGVVMFAGDMGAAVAICADVGDSAHPRRAAAGGARIYLASMFAIPSDYDRDAARLAAYARDHGMLVALANYGGPSGGMPAAGRSAAWSDTGRLIMQLPPNGPGVGVVFDSAGGWVASQPSPDKLAGARLRESPEPLDESGPQSSPPNDL